MTTVLSLSPPSSDRMCWRSVAARCRPGRTAWCLARASCSPSPCAVHGSAPPRWACRVRCRTFRRDPFADYAVAHPQTLKPAEACLMPTSPAVQVDDRELQHVAHILPIGVTKSKTESQSADSSLCFACRRWRHQRAAARRTRSTMSVWPASAASPAKRCRGRLFLFLAFQRAYWTISTTFMNDGAHKRSDVIFGRADFWLTLVYGRCGYRANASWRAQPR